MGWAEGRHAVGRLVGATGQHFDLAAIIHTLWTHMCSLASVLNSHEVIPLFSLKSSPLVFVLSRLNLETGLSVFKLPWRLDDKWPYLSFS